MPYYREKNGDYMWIRTPAYRSVGPEKFYEGRITNISHRLTSICTGSVSSAYLRDSKKVAKSQVPEKWVIALGIDKPTCKVMTKRRKR